MVANFLDLHNLSWKRRAFALAKDGRIVWNTVFFLSAVKHRKVIHFKASVFPPYLQHYGLLRTRNVSTMATWRNDFSSLLLGSLFKSVFERLTSTGSLFAFILNYPDTTKFCIPMCLYCYRDNLFKNWGKPPSKNAKKKTTNGWRASLKKRLCLSSILVEQKIQGTWCPQELSPLNFFNLNADWAPEK